MGILERIIPARAVLNPVLADETLIDMEGPSTAAFYTPLARDISRYMELIIAAGAGACLLLAWTIHLLDGSTPLKNLLTLLAFAIAGIPALESVWGKLSRFRVDIDLLMVLGAGLAAYVGSPFEGALLLFLFALSGGLEAMAIRRTQSAITSLRDLAPPQATVMQGDQTTLVLLRQVALGALVLVRPGEKIPLDGVVTDGASSLDESAITGESFPRDCTEGDSVFAGTQNLNGRLVVRVTKLASDTTLAKIVALVTEAKQNPARAQRLIDRIGPTYSIIVILAACATALLWWMFGLEAKQAIHRAIAVLIVGSPCALLIATPVAYLSAIAGAARRGVLIKGGAHLESVAGAKAIAFDKTGTLTTGQIELTDVVVGDGMDEATALAVAGAIEGSGTHPLARAVSEAVASRGLTSPAIEDYAYTPGEGGGGIVEGRSVWIGKPESALGKVSPEQGEWLQREVLRMRTAGSTASALVVGDQVALLAFNDTIRDGSKACVIRLRKQGIKRVEMLTGDHEVVARKVADELALDGFQASLLPQEKAGAMNRMQSDHGNVCLVGDGINDAPALAVADTGIAMGAMASPIALDAADIVLMHNRIGGVAWLHAHALRTTRLVRQNLGIAIGVIVVMSVFAVLGSIPLPLAVIGHEGSTIVVAINALRLLRTKA